MSNRVLLNIADRINRAASERKPHLAREFLMSLTYEQRQLVSTMRCQLIKAKAQAA